MVSSYRILLASDASKPLPAETQHVSSAKIIGVIPTNKSKKFRSLLAIFAVFLIHAAMLVAAPTFLLESNPPQTALLSTLWTAPILPGRASGAETVALKSAAIFLSAIGLLFYTHLTKRLIVSGVGTPAVWEPPTVLIRDGGYRINRNPMYTSVLLIAAGEALFFNRLLLAVYLGALWLGLHLFVLWYEEPQLVRQFGAPYADYCRTVPRWLSLRTLRRLR